MCFIILKLYIVTVFIISGVSLLHLKFTLFIYTTIIKSEMIKLVKFDVSRFIADLPKLEIDENSATQQLQIASQWKPVVTYSGYPKPEITWYKNGKLLESDKKCKIYTEETTSTIAIYSVERKDTATYTIKATNSAGSASAEISLKVIGKHVLKNISYQWDHIQRIYLWI